MTLAWLFDDEKTERAESVFDQVVAEGAVVPALWWLEIASAVRKGARRGRFDEAYVDGSLASLSELFITTDDQTARRAWSDTMSLSRTEDLTPYDACYLELAIRQNLPLATGDAALATAARNRGVAVLTP